MFDAVINQQPDGRDGRQKDHLRAILVLPGKMAKTGEHGEGRRNGLGAKENPGYSYHHQSESAAKPTRRSLVSPQQAFDAKPGSVDAAPYDKSPVGAVPQAAKQHGEHQVLVSLQCAVTIPA